jgi:hypothetical protein
MTVEAAIHSAVLSRDGSLESVEFLNNLSKLLRQARSEIGTRLLRQKSNEHATAMRLWDLNSRFAKSSCTICTRIVIITALAAYNSKSLSDTNSCIMVRTDHIEFRIVMS